MLLRSHPWNRTSCTVVFAMLALAGCREVNGPPSRVPTSIVLSEEFPLLEDGQTLQLAATLIDQNGKAITPPPSGHAFQWSSADPHIASVTDRGLVTAHRHGTTRITAQVREITAEAALRVQGVPTTLHLLGGDGQRVAVGERLPEPLRVRVTDRHGEGIPGVEISPQVSGGGGWAGTARTTEAGIAEIFWWFGTVAGEHTLVASVYNRPLPPLTFRATGYALAPARLEPGSGGALTGRIREALAEALIVKVTDEHGNPVAAVPVSWTVVNGGGSVLAPPATDSAGTVRAVWTLGASRGYQRVEAYVEQIAGARVDFRANATGGSSPLITGITPYILRPGVSATIQGEGFAADAARTTVTIDGVHAAVTQASASQLSVVLPARSSFRCEPTREVPVTVEVADEPSTTALNHLAVAVQHDLRVGESVRIRDPEDLLCHEFPTGNGVYGISVFNSSRSANAFSPVRLRTAWGNDPSSAPDLSSRARTPPLRSAVRHPDLSPPRALQAHHRIQEANRGLLQRLGAPRRVQRDAVIAAAGASRVPAVGERIALRVPDFTTSNPCENYHPVTGRTVYAGSRAVILEDVAAPLGGRVDAALRELGREFDETMFEILTTYFGDPLAYDAQLDANGRILMLFTPRVNDLELGGFVSTTDFFPGAACPASNVAEIFYAGVPTDSSAGFGANTAEAWKWSVRSLVIHEVKHITSVAERLARAGSGAVAWEETWLEEATARAAEELWARSVYGYAYRGNTGYAASLECEIKCPGKPLAMLSHFDGLYQFYSRIEALSPLGPVDEHDWTFYASGWWFVRWAADHHADGEAAFFRALTQEAQRTGISNLEARTGRSFADLMADWSLAIVGGDTPDARPERPELRVESWNAHDVFRGLSFDFRSFFPRAFPLALQEFPGGGGTVDVPVVRGGSAAYLRVAGDYWRTQLLELRSLSGGRPAASLGIAIIRLQ